MRNQRSTAQESEQEQAVVESEDFFIRNFDTRWGYDLTVRVRDDDEPVFVSQYFLTPGKTAQEMNRIPPGEYEFIVELDGERRTQETCRVGPRLDQTALIEIGNGTVSITQGLYS